MNSLPLFHHLELNPHFQLVDLNEDVNHHVVKVLRMVEGEQFKVTNGRGLSATATIQIATKKKLTVQLDNFVCHPPFARKLILGISLLKNASRFEWMLEKVTEIGITEIFPLRCERTEKQHYKKERFEQIIISACLQSQQFYFPQLHEPIGFHEMLHQQLPQKRYIAHCIDTEKSLLSSTQGDAVLLVGPEGDFSVQEIDQAIALQFIPVSLGSTRLRTETAGVVGAVLLQ